MEPTTLVLAGAALPIFGGLLGAWIQGRREHNRWIRERRFDAYLDYITMAHKLTFDRSELESASKQIAQSEAQVEVLRQDAEKATSDAERDEIRARASSLMERLNGLVRNNEAATGRLGMIEASMIDKAAPFSLLGPETVWHAASRASSTEPDPAKRRANLSALEAAMRKSLNIKS